MKTRKANPIASTAGVMAAKVECLILQIVAVVSFSLEF